MTRFAEHFYNAAWGYDFYFYKALRKYGRDAFDVQELVSTETEKSANNLERLYIILFKSSESEFGYNGTLGGDGVAPTPELRRKQSECKLGPKNPNYGKTTSDAQKRAMSIASKGENNQKYRKDLILSEIIDLYMKGNSCSKIAFLKKTCSDAVRDRLVSAGVYKPGKGRRYILENRQEPITR